MSFKIDLTERPMPILVKWDGGEFRLIHTYLNAFERAQAVEAMGSAGLSGAAEILWDHVISWEGVTAPDGTPIPFQRQVGDGLKSSLPAVMGRVPFLNQVLAILQQLALNGVRLTRVRSAIAQFVETPEEVEQVEKVFEDFLKQAGRPAGELLSASSAVETLPSRSA